MILLFCQILPTNHQIHLTVWKFNHLTVLFFLMSKIMWEVSILPTAKCYTLMLMGRQFKVHMRPNLFLHSYNNYIYRLKYMIPKFEMSRIKIGDFTSTESWAVLPRKMAFKSRGLNTMWQQPVTSIWGHKLTIQYGGKRERGGKKREMLHCSRP